MSNPTGFDRIGVIYLRNFIRVDALHSSGVNIRDVDKGTAHLSPRIPDDFNHIALDGGPHARR